MACRHSHRYFCVCPSLGLTKTTLTKIVAKSKREVGEAAVLWLCLPRQLCLGLGKRAFVSVLFHSVLFFCFFASGLGND